jgi:hypothetical protein
MTEPTLSEALRLAADLVDKLGWDHGITWQGTHTIHLHAADDSTHEALLRKMPILAPAPRWGVLEGDDYTCDTSEWWCQSGLRVTVFGPRRALTEAVAP